MRVKTIPLSEHVKGQIEEICDAFGKGFDQADRNEANPYNKDCALHYAYEYGKEVANGQTKGMQDESWTIYVHPFHAV